MSASKVLTMFSFRTSLRDQRILYLAAEISETSVSEFIRSAVMPAAKDTLVTHAIELPSEETG